MLVRRYDSSALDGLREDKDTERGFVCSVYHCSVL